MYKIEIKNCNSIKNGKIDKFNLNKIGYDLIKLETFLQNNKIYNLKSVGIFTVDGNGRFYLQQIGKKFTTGYIDIDEEKKW